MIVYGGLNAAAAFGVALLFVLVYALFFAAFALALYYFIRAIGLGGLLFAAPLWVTIELIRANFFFGGFPWMLSGYALVPYEGVLQAASWTGIYGLSFLAAAVNSVLAAALFRRSVTLLAAGAAAIAVAWVLPIIGETHASESIPVRIVQTNISLDQSWDQHSGSVLLDEIERLSIGSRQLEGVIVWPETPAPLYIEEDATFRARVARIAQAADSYFVLGYVGTAGEGSANSAAVISPQGRMISRYDKMHLVPFGEYVPLKRLLFFAEKMVRHVGDFTRGTSYTISPVGSRRLSTVICYESIFPNIVRQFVRRGSELVVVITNDGWFGTSSAPYQHLRMGVVRAVENRRYVIRAANTGVSAIIDPYGRIEAQTEIGVRTALDGAAKFRSDRTFYAAYGDIFAYLNVAAVGFLPLTTLVRRRPKMNIKLKEPYVRRTH